MNKGVETLSSNFDDWSDVLKNSDAASEEYYEALTSLRSAMSDLLDVSENSLSDAFLTDANNLALME
jgi:hypothetical protein